MDLTKRVDDVTIEFIQDAGSTPAWSKLWLGLLSKFTRSSGLIQIQGLI